MKKRSCRRTADEDRIHEQAIKMRKMTDEQLIRYVDSQISQAREEGKAEGAKSAAAVKPKAAPKAKTKTAPSASDFVDFLKREKLQGIGPVTVSRIMRVAEENGYVS